MKMKYRLSKKDYITVGDRRLYRIVAVRDVNRDVKKGALGGYIEKEANLSHEGECWVHSDAMVYGNARLYDNVRVGDRETVFGNACLGGCTLLFGRTHAYGGKD